MSSSLELLDRVQLVRGAEAVEEVQERDPRSQRRGVRDEREVVGFLHRGGAQQGEAGLAYLHHVRVVSEDRERLGGQRTGRDVEHHRGQLAGDLVHVGDHQQQALRGGERGAERAALENAVQGAGRARLALHLDHGRDGPPQVGPLPARPLVGQLGHRRGGRDREDAADLAASVRDRRGRLVAVDRRAHQVWVGTVRSLEGPRTRCTASVPPRGTSRSSGPGTARSRPGSPCSGRSRSGSESPVRA